MKRKNIFFLFLLFLLSACGNKDKKDTAESDVNVATGFIRYALDGKFNDARTYLLSDSVNTNYMDVAERSYKKAEQAVKDGYRESTINIHLVDPVNDSTTVVIYSNSFKKDHDTLKVLRTNGKWLVDLKYLYLHDADSIGIKPTASDSLK
jgi:hypothetical protein